SSLGRNLAQPDGDSSLGSNRGTAPTPVDDIPARADAGRALLTGRPDGPLPRLSPGGGPDGWSIQTLAVHKQPCSPSPSNLGDGDDRNAREALIRASSMPTSRQSTSQKRCELLWRVYEA